MSTLKLPEAKKFSEVKTTENVSKTAKNFYKCLKIYTFFL